MGGRGKEKGKQRGSGRESERKGREWNEGYSYSVA